MQDLQCLLQAAQSLFEAYQLRPHDEYISVPCERKDLYRITPWYSATLTLLQSGTTLTRKASHRGVPSKSQVQVQEEKSKSASKRTLYIQVEMTEECKSMVADFKPPKCSVVWRLLRFPRRISPSILYMLFRLLTGNGKVFHSFHDLTYVHS